MLRKNDDIAISYPKSAVRINLLEQKTDLYNIRSLVFNLADKINQGSDEYHALEEIWDSLADVIDSVYENIDILEMVKTHR